MFSFYFGFCRLAFYLFSAGLPDLATRHPTPEGHVVAALAGGGMLWQGDGSALLPAAGGGKAVHRHPCWWRLSQRFLAHANHEALG